MSRRKYAINRDVFLNEDNLSYYLLGAIMADGTVSDVKRSRYVSLYSKDDDWLTNIRNIVSPEKPIYKKKIGVFEFKISDIEILNWFKSKQCLPNKSLTLSMPDVPLPI